MVRDRHRLKKAQRQTEWEGERWGEKRGTDVEEENTKNTDTLTDKLADWL